MNFGIFRPELLAFLLGVSLAATASGESGRSSRRGHFTHLDSTDGLPNSVVRQMLQDKQGFMWLGTQNGLARFDGFRFESYAHDPADSGSLSGDFVMSLHEDSQETLWIGTQSDGLNRFESETRTFVRYRHDPENPDSLAHDSVLVIHEGAEGDLWLGTGNGLDRYRPEIDGFEHYRHHSPDEESHLYNQIKALWQDPSGVLWVGTQGGLARLDRESGRTVVVPHPAALGQILSLSGDQPGELWIGAEHGFFRWDAPRQEIMAVPVSSADSAAIGWLAGEIIALHEDRRGVLWISTGRDVVGMDPRRGSVVSWYRAGEDNSIPGDYVWDIAEDRSGGLWFGTRSGVSRLEPRHQVFTHYRATDSGRRLGNVASLHEDRSGDLWVGTWGRGLHRFGLDATPVGHYRNDPEDPSSLSNDWVWSIFEDSQGELWFGHNLGLDRWDRERETFVHLQTASDDSTGFGPGGVGGIEEDPSGDLWVAKSSHLSRLDPRTGRLTRYAPDPTDPRGLGGQNLLALHIDRQGELWICSDGDGLLRFDRERDNFDRFQHDPTDVSSLSNDQLSSIYEDTDGTLWLGTLGGGVSGLESSRDALRRVGRQDGLPSDWVTGIQGDGQGNLWIGTDKGLARYDPVGGEVRLYDATDGALTTFSARAHARGRNGALFFGGSQDLITFLPEKIERVEMAAPIFITGLQTLGSESAGKGYRPDLLPHPVRQDDMQIVLTPKDHLFSIEFAALEYANPEKVEFLYQLEGYDNAWIPTDAIQPAAQYSRVAPGTYTFRVRAANRDGIWDEPGASLSVKVLPAYWQTWWAYVLYCLAAATIVLAFVRSQRKMVVFERAANAERERLIDQLKARNARLASFNHAVAHDLRNPLTTIKNYVGLIRRDAGQGNIAQFEQDLKRVDLAADRLHRQLEDLFEISRTDRETHRSHQVFLDEVVREARDLVADSAAKCGAVIAITHHLPRAQGDRSQLLKVFSHLLANAIKFLGDQTAPRIEVGMRHEAGQQVIYVRDNGMGIAEAYQERVFEVFERLDGGAEGTGAGLALVKRIVEAHGGRIWVESDGPGHGSTFCFTLPVESPSEF